MKKYLSVAVSENEYFSDTTDKIEFTGCKTSNHTCLDFLPIINDLFRESERFHRIKNFDQALNSLDQAFKTASEIKDSNCQQCSLFFKATIIQSIENLHNELSRMRSGWFATHRYDSSYFKAEAMLKKFRKPVHATSLENKFESIADLQPAYS
ncbi:MAG TPA: hypothetical protein VFD91_14490 [Mariniphaga sp.]|nr:hypothetical protein [Mariniphaga sp.]